MTRAIAILILLLSAISIQAQTEDLDKQLLKKYSSKELIDLKVNYPSQYEFDKYCVKNAFYIAASSQQKSSDYDKIKIKDLDNINFFELNIDLKENDHQPFIIKGTSKLLIIKSRTHLLNELKTK